MADQALDLKRLFGNALPGARRADKSCPRRKAHMPIIESVERLQNEELNREFNIRLATSKCMRGPKSRSDCLVSAEFTTRPQPKGTNQ